MTIKVVPIIIPLNTQLFADKHYSLEIRLARGASRWTTALSESLTEQYRRICISIHVKFEWQITIHWKLDGQIVREGSRSQRRVPLLHLKFVSDAHTYTCTEKLLAARVACSHMHSHFLSPTRTRCNALCSIEVISCNVSDSVTPGSRRIFCDVLELTGAARACGHHLQEFVDWWSKTVQFHLE